MRRRFNSRCVDSPGVRTVFLVPSFGPHFWARSYAGAPSSPIPWSTCLTSKEVRRLASSRLTPSSPEVSLDGLNRPPTASASYDTTPPTGFSNPLRTCCSPFGQTPVNKQGPRNLAVWYSTAIFPRPVRQREPAGAAQEDIVQSLPSTRTKSSAVIRKSFHGSFQTSQPYGATHETWSPWIDLVRWSISRTYETRRIVRSSGPTPLTPLSVPLSFKPRRDERLRPPEVGDPNTL
jgi:hypothetical protein